MVWNTECEKYETVRDVIVDETHFLQSRSLIEPEGSNNKYSQSKTGSDLVSKPVCLRSSDLSISKLDDSKSNEKGSPCKIRRINEVVESEIIIPDSSPVNNDTTSNKPFTCRRSERLKGCPRVAYPLT